MTTPDTFDITKESTRLEIRFSSSVENIDRVDAETRRFLKSAALEPKIFGICLVMREALTNAVKHGHNFDAFKAVQYVLEVKEDLVVMEVEDQGPGFDWREVKARRPVLDSEHGRGLAIIEKYCSHCRFNDKGNKLFLNIDLDEASGVDEQTSAD